MTTTRAAHTAGPWVVASDGPNGINIRRDSGDRIGSIVGRAAGNLDEPESVANARLIAAAPELLEKTQWALERLSNFMTDIEKAQFQNAISKATGAA